jgi:hypothetical protein
LIRGSIRYALHSISHDETLLLSGLGTGIGGLDEDVFVRILKEEYIKLKTES